MKKKGLKRAGVSGLRAGSGGYSYLREPSWWAGMLTMIIGEVANFAAYAYAPAILVTPLGAISIIVSAGLAHVIFKEKLHALGILGCMMCIMGSVTMVLHAPKDRDIGSMKEVWQLATQSDFLMYMASVFVLVLVLAVFIEPHYGRTHVTVCIGICSLVGSLSVMSVKALGIAIKLTVQGDNQFFYPETWIFLAVVFTCVLTQLNYLNRALDAFDTAVVSLVYYVMFTSFTILASMIMFKNWKGQSTANIISESCGFLIILSGMVLLLSTKDLQDSKIIGINLYSAFSASLSTRLLGGVAELKHPEYSVR